MRTPLITLLSGVFAGLLFTGTAAAGVAGQEAAPAPTGTKALTSNPIYKTGTLDVTSCQEQPVKADDLDSSRVYLEFVVECLNDTWGRQFAKAKLPFSKPGFQTTARLGYPTGCGPFPKGAQAVYCAQTKRITFLLNPSILSESTELFLLEVIAHEYGHHVQRLSGMTGALDHRKYRTKKALLADIRKIELQAECLGGAFIGSIWRDLGRSESDLRYVVSYAYDTVSHGKARNVAHWLNRGFTQESPGACNTWTAAPSKVS
ncbi:neutral zinc metallopeptidase [Streptosporangium sandarakinum]|uniref:neutral zinc metallopeptidase n=1 Tax=Streptosporangium sandarakinum TaxID=1260955 RepID=UPI0036C8450E